MKFTVFYVLASGFLFNTTSDSSDFNTEEAKDPLPNSGIQVMGKFCECVCVSVCVCVRRGTLPFLCLPPFSLEVNV